MYTGCGRHFAALTAAGLSYAAGTGLNLLAAGLHGGWMPTGTQAAPLYWIGDRFPIIGAHAGFTRWASIGDFLVWTGELVVAVTWATWAAELVHRRHSSVK